MARPIELSIGSARLDERQKQSFFLVRETVGKGCYDENGVRKAVGDKLHAVYVALLEFVERLAFAENPLDATLPEIRVPIEHHEVRFERLTVVALGGEAQRGRRRRVVVTC